MEGEREGERVGNGDHSCFIAIEVVALAVEEKAQIR